MSRVWRSSRKKRHVTIQQGTALHHEHPQSPTELFGSVRKKRIAVCVAKSRGVWYLTNSTSPEGQRHCPRARKLNPTRMIETKNMGRRILSYLQEKGQKIRKSRMPASSAHESTGGETSRMKRHFQGGTKRSLETLVCGLSVSTRSGPRSTYSGQVGHQEYRSEDRLPRVEDRSLLYSIVRGERSTFPATAQELFLCSYFTGGNSLIGGRKFK